MPISVAIVEDDPEIREMLTRAVQRATSLTFVASFPNGEEALIALPKLAPNVVVMDLQLPGMSGVECTRKLTPLLTNTQVLVFTVFMDSDQIFQALAAGAKGYLLKRTSRQGIVEAIEQVWHGGAPMTAEIARRVVESFQNTGPAKKSAAKEAQLTAREEEVLRLLADGKPTKIIAVELNLSAETVRFHLKHIYEKLHVRSRTEAVIKFLQ